MTVLDEDLAYVIGFPCEAALYGAYCILFLVSLTVLVWRPRSRDINYPLLFANILLFLCCTAHFSLEFNHFIAIMDVGMVAGYANETHKLLGADILFSLIDFIGDMILIYRCWLVWKKNYYVIIIPFLTAFSGFCCIMEVAQLIRTLDPNAPEAPAALIPLGNAGYALPLAANVLLTVLIAGRIHWFARGDGVVALEASTARTTRRAMAIVVESGLLYSAASLAHLVLFAIPHPAQSLVSSMAVQIFGIAPTLIVIRVGLGIAADSSGGSDAISPMSWYHSTMERTGVTETTNSGWGMRNAVEFDGKSKEENASSSEVGVQTAALDTSYLSAR